MSNTAEAIQPTPTSRQYARDSIKPRTRLVGPRYLYEGLNISRVTLWRYIRDGKIPEPKTSLGRPTWTQCRADEIIQAHG